MRHHSGLGQEVMAPPHAVAMEYDLFAEAHRHWI